jgi:hypothetical protein
MQALPDLLKKTPKNNGAKGQAGGGTRGSKKEPRVDAPPTISDLGIPKKLSSRAQALADVPDDDFEAALVDVPRDREISANVVAHAARRRLATRKIR